ncbi:MAG: hypothetical protein J3K34DRAFT_245773 [Monoraphidium minutum]|nr:MAG: hypothetical protein J3K34DRAFT_245773 [Monoraphidium minutum]
MLSQQQAAGFQGVAGPSRRCAAGALQPGRSERAAAAGRLRRACRARPVVAAPPAAAPWLGGDDPAGRTSSAAACSTSGADGGLSLGRGGGSSSRRHGGGSPAVAAPLAAPAGLHAPRRGVACAAGKAPGGGKDTGGGKPGGGGGGKPGGGKSGGGGGSQKQGKGSADDKADPNKADFSAYWSLRFREFFSGRRQYLELSRKRQEPPEVVQKVDAQIAEQRRRLEEATQAKRDHAREEYLAQVTAEARAVLDVAAPTDEDIEAMRRLPTSVERMQSDLDAARAHLQSPLVKAAAITSLQLRAAAAAAAAAPLAVPAALLARWRALFSAQRYEAFLLAEGERVWFWRNRMENERWFWEVFFLDRLVIPAAWILGYLYLVPNNLIWAVVVPFVTLYWQDGKLPSPRNMEWWLIMIFGLYGKCWPQVAGALSMVLQWW